MRIILHCRYQRIGICHYGLLRLLLAQVAQRVLHPQGHTVIHRSRLGIRVDTGYEQIQLGDNFIGNVKCSVKIANVGLRTDEDAYIGVDFLQFSSLPLAIQVGPGIFDTDYRSHGAVVSNSNLHEPLLLGCRYDLRHTLTAVTQMGMAMIITEKAHLITCSLCVG